LNEFPSCPNPERPVLTKITKAAVLPWEAVRCLGAEPKRHTPPLQAVQ
jgi:hypothetical protein